jgi:hypothetical protein
LCSLYFLLRERRRERERGRRGEKRRRFKNASARQSFLMMVFFALLSIFY